MDGYYIHVFKRFHDNKSHQMTKKATYFLLVPLIAFITISCDKSTKDKTDYEGPSSISNQSKKLSIEEQELANPAEFLKADGTFRENFMGDKLKVSSTIRNSATVATFKDAKVRVTYYSKSKTNLGSEDYTIWDVFKPRTKKVFKLKIKNYRNVSTIGWTVVDASPY